MADHVDRIVRANRAPYVQRARNHGIGATTLISANSARRLILSRTKVPCSGIPGLGNTVVKTRTRNLEEDGLRFRAAPEIHPDLVITGPLHVSSAGWKPASELL